MTGGIGDERVEEGEKGGDGSGRGYTGFVIEKSPR